MFSQHLSLAGPHAAALAAELVQEPFQGPNPCEASGPSLLKQLHVQLLTLVRDWQAAALDHMSGPFVQTCMQLMHSLMTQAGPVLHYERWFLDACNKLMQCKVTSAVAHRPVAQ